LEARASSFNTPNEVEGIIQLLGLEPGARVFDAGCGPGRIANALAKEGMDVLGVDVNPELVEIALTTPSGAMFLEGDYLDVPVDSDESFDAVLSWHTSWGYDTHERNVQFFSRACALLKPGGQLLLQTWNPLGLSEQMSHNLRLADGTLLCEILDFDPTNFTINLDRATFGPAGNNREQAQCYVYTFPEIQHYALQAGFDDVTPVSIPFDHPWQILIATKSIPS
jgi:SAM-dependent methyltransferase